MTRLSVNINKVALIRNARGGNTPDLYQVARDLEAFGADGITVHPRPDERHVRFSDIPVLRELVTTEFNIEGYPSPAFLDMVCKFKPDQCTLVPDPPEALTSSTGWDTQKNMDFLQDVVAKLHAHGIRVSIFLNAEPELIPSAKNTGTDRIELYTGPYAESYEADREAAIAPFIATAFKANEYGLAINAGHDLNLDNLRYFHQNIPELAEVSIGQALVSDALYFGFHNTVQMYKNLLK